MTYHIIWPTVVFTTFQDVSGITNAQAAEPTLMPGVEGYFCGDITPDSGRRTIFEVDLGGETLTKMLIGYSGPGLVTKHQVAFKLKPVSPGDFSGRNPGKAYADPYEVFDIGGDEFKKLNEAVNIILAATINSYPLLEKPPARFRYRPAGGQMPAAVYLQLTDYADVALLKSPSNNCGSLY